MGIGRYFKYKIKWIIKSKKIALQKIVIMGMDIIELILIYYD